MIKVCVICPDSANAAFAMERCPGQPMPFMLPAERGAAPLADIQISATEL